LAKFISRNLDPEKIVAIWFVVKEMLVFEIEYCVVKVVPAPLAYPEIA